MFFTNALACSTASSDAGPGTMFVVVIAVVVAAADTIIQSNVSPGMSFVISPRLYIFLF